MKHKKHTYTCLDRIFNVHKVKELTVNLKESKTLVGSFRLNLECKICDGENEYYFYFLLINDPIDQYSINNGHIGELRESV